jgi:hypothetical protein
MIISNLTKRGKQYPIFTKKISTGCAQCQTAASLGCCVLGGAKFKLASV